MPVTISTEDGEYILSSGDWSFKVSTEVAVNVVVDEGYVFIEHTDGMYSAHSPTEGVASQGETLEKAKRNLAEAIALHREVDTL